MYDCMINFFLLTSLADYNCSNTSTLLNIILCTKQHEMFVFLFSSTYLDTRRCPGMSLSRDQLLPSICPWLQNRCLAINNSSLLVSADMSHVPVAWYYPGWNIHISIFPHIFRPFGQNATFLPAYTLPYTYTIR
jgi:hypothetical protein